MKECPVCKKYFKSLKIHFSLQIWHRRKNKLGEKHWDYEKKNYLTMSKYYAI